MYPGFLHDAVETRFLGAPVGIGDGRVGHGAIGAERADRRAHKPGMHYYISGTLSLVPGTLYLRAVSDAGRIRPYAVCCPILLLDSKTPRLRQ